MTNPCDLSALEARHLIGTRELSPVEFSSRASIASKR